MSDNDAMPAGKSPNQETLVTLLCLGILTWLADSILLAARMKGEVKPLHLVFSLGVVALACIAASLLRTYRLSASVLAAAATSLVWFARFGASPTSALRICAAIGALAMAIAAASLLDPRRLAAAIPFLLLGHHWFVTRHLPQIGVVVATILITPLMPIVFDAVRSQRRLVLGVGFLAILGSGMAAIPLRARVDSRTWTQRAPAPAASNRPNVVLIVIDTLRADRLGLSGYRARPVSPFLDSLALRATPFPRAYSASSWTMPSVASIMTGVPAGIHGVTTSDHVIAPAVPTLAEVLRSSEYFTAGVSANFGLDQAHGYARGYSRYTVLWRLVRGTWENVPSIWDDLSSVLLTYYDDWADLLPDWNWKPHADAVTLRAIQEIDAAPKTNPLFLYVQYVDPHAPCDAIHKEWTISDADHGYDRHWSLEYDREVRDLDQSLQRLMSHVDARLDPAKTMLIVVADHGEQLGEDGFRGHGVNLSEATIRVPLLIRFPTGVQPPANPAAPISTARIFAIAAGASDASSSSLVHSSLVTGRNLIRSVTDGSFKLIQNWTLDPPQLAGERLLQLPDEQHNILVREPATALRLRASLDADPIPNAGSDALSAESRAKLRALGYLH